MITRVSDETPETSAYLLYTSGSTGRPKGVVQNDGNVLHFISAYSNALHISQDDRLTLFASYGLDAAVMDIFAAVLGGACLVISDFRERGLAELFEWVDQQGVTIWHSTPTVFRAALQSSNAPVSKKVRLVVLGGEEARDIDLHLFKSRFDSQCVFVNGFGPTESTVTTQYFADQTSTLAGSRVPIGSPVVDTEVFLATPEGTRAELTGEMVVRSPYVAIGYWRDEEQTQRAFDTDTSTPHLRLYRTGDLARWRADGLLEFLGRADRQIKIQGFRVEPGEIEAVLQRLPDVREAAVLPTDGGRNDTRLVAYVSGDNLTVSSLRTQLKRLLPDYMIPTSFVVLQRLPLLPNGKLDRGSLPAPRYELSSDIVAPRSPIEQAVSDIWTEVLQRTSFGVHDNFFDVGGHSLYAAQVLARVKSILGVDLPMRALFEYPTIAELAAYIRTKDKDLRLSNENPIPSLSPERVATHILGTSGTVVHRSPDRCKCDIQHRDRSGSAA